jgi:hypothetical protein
VAASAWPCSDSESTHVWAQACSEADSGTGFVWRQHRRSLSVRCWLRCAGQGGGAGQGHAVRMGVLAHPGYARAPAGLHRGLDGVLSAASVRPLGQAA